MQKYILILFLIAMTSASNYAMSNSDQEKDQSIIVRTVVRDMISRLPPNTNQICVVEMDLSVGKSLGRKLLNLRDMDSRIVTDSSICLDRLTKPKNSATIMVSNMVPVIEKMARPSDRKGQVVYDRALVYIKEGNILVGTLVDICGADGYIYAFKTGKGGPQLIYSAVFDSVQCTTIQK